MEDTQDILSKKDSFFDNKSHFGKIDSLFILKKKYKKYKKKQEFEDIEYLEDVEEYENILSDQNDRVILF